MSAIARQVARINERFNGESLEMLMECFSERAVFRDAQGVDHVGKEQIAVAFSPLFDGSLGKVRFDWTETIIDAAAEKAVVLWTLSMERNGTTTRLHGLDVFAIEGGLVVSKNTFLRPSGANG